MNTHRTDRDDDLMHRYREASTAAAERPSASARAAILAAAARQVHAKPADAKSPYRRARWPLAAAAAVMLSTLAVMLAIRTQEEMPQFEAPAGSGAVSQRPASPAVSEPPQRDQKTEEETAQLQSKPAREPLAGSQTGSARAAADELTEPKRAVPGVKPAPAAASDRVDSSADQNRARAAAPAPGYAAEPPGAPPAEPAADAAAPPVPLAKTPAPAVKQRAEIAGGLTSPTPPLDQSGTDARQNEARPTTPAPAAAAPAERSAETRRDAGRSLSGASSQSPAAEAVRNEADQSAASWLERIIKLRREGRHTEADVELKRFRERHPQVQVPREALPAGAPQ